MVGGNEATGISARGILDFDEGDEIGGLAGEELRANEDYDDVYNDAWLTDFFFLVVFDGDVVKY